MLVHWETTTTGSAVFTPFINPKFEENEVLKTDSPDMRHLDLCIEE